MQDYFCKQKLPQLGSQSVAAEKEKRSCLCRPTTTCSIFMGCMSPKRQCCLPLLAAYMKLWSCRGSISTCSRATCWATMASQPAHLWEMGGRCSLHFQTPLSSSTPGRLRWTFGRRDARSYLHLDEACSLILVCGIVAHQYSIQTFLLL